MLLTTVSISFRWRIMTVFRFWEVCPFLFPVFSLVKIWIWMSGLIWRILVQKAASTSTPCSGWIHLTHDMQAWVHRTQYTAYRLPFKNLVFYLNIFESVIYSCDVNFQHHYSLQSSASHDPSKIILICCSRHISHYYWCWVASYLRGNIPFWGFFDE